MITDNSEDAVQRVSSLFFAVCNIFQTHASLFGGLREQHGCGAIQGIKRVAKNLLTLISCY